MRFLGILIVLAACGGSEPAAAPEPTPAPEVAPAPAPEPEPEKVDPMEEFTALADDEARHAYLMDLGKRVYEKGEGGIACQTCHQADGKGTPGAFPPLVGQKDHMGDCQKHAGMVINGLNGELVVDGVTYNGVMTPQGELLDDLKIAAVLTYERNSWGNDFGGCSPEEVAKAR